MYFCGLVIVCVRRRVSVRAMKTVSCKVMVRSEMRRMGDGYWGAICPGTQASPPAFKEVRSPGRTIVCPGAQASPPAIKFALMGRLDRFLEKIFFDF